MITIEWAIPLSTPFGQYRITYTGTSRDVFQKLSQFTAYSSTFSVNPATSSSGAGVW